MSNTIIELRHSYVTGNVPSNLANGEIAINTYDGKLFYRGGPSNTIQTIERYSGPAGLDTEIQFNDSGVLGSASNLTFDKLAGLFRTGNVTANTVTTRDYVQFGDGTRQYTANAGSGVGGNVINVYNANTQVFTGTANGTGTTFNLGFTPASQNSVIVTANGVVQYDYTVTNSTLILNFTPTVGTLIRAQTFGTSQANSLAGIFETGNLIVYDGNTLVSLANTNTAGTYGNSTHVPVITTDQYGRVLSVTNTSISGLGANDQYARDTANAAFTRANNSLNANTGGSVSGSISATGQLEGSILRSTQSSGDEGGQIDLSLAATNQSLTGGVAIDIYQNRFRIFETGGSNRGVYIDMANGASIGVGTNLLNPSATPDTEARNTANAAFIAANSAGVYANSAFNHANASFVVANSAAIAANTPSHVANSASIYANGAFTVANAAFTTANGTIAWNTANAAFNAANTADSKAVASGNYANAAFVVANTADDKATSAGVYSNTAFDVANTAAIAANTPSHVANSASIYANGAFAQANVAYTDAAAASSYANSAFSVANTSNINSLSAGSYANAAFLVANAAFTTANGTITWNTANAAFNAANVADSKSVSAGSYANSAFDVANSASIFANTPSQVANSAGIYANGAFAAANNEAGVNLTQNNSITAAFTRANNSLNANTGGTITGNVVVAGDFAVTGNITITGNTITQNVTTLNITDPLIYLAANNYSSDIVEIGFAANYYDGANNRHTGFFREASNKEYYVFDNYLPEPDSNLIDINDVSFRVATLHANIVSTVATIGGVDIKTYVDNAFNAANAATATDVTQNNSITAAFNHVNSSFELANSASIAANTPSHVANSAAIYANGAFAKANSLVLTVSLTDDSNNFTNVVSNITGIRFDANSGFDITDLGSGNVKVGMNSTFKTWKITGQSDLIANGLDTIEFVGSNGVVLTSNTLASPKTITFDTSQIFNVANTANAVYVNDSPPSSPKANTLWWQSNTATLKIYYNDGITSQWVDTNQTYSTDTIARIIANAAFIQANSSYAHANASFITANDAFFFANVGIQNANSAHNTANAAFLVANNAFTGANGTIAWNTANAAFNTANNEAGVNATQNTLIQLAWNHANAAYNQANTGGGGGGASVSVSDSPPPMANANSLWWQSNTATLKIYYDDGSGSQWVDATPISAYDYVARANAVYANNHSIAAFNQANAAFNAANNALDTWVRGQANSAFDQANAAFSVANNAFTSANGTIAWNTANAAFVAANNVAPQVQPSFDHANSAFIQANAAFNAANTINLNKIYQNNTRVQVSDSNTTNSNVVFVVNNVTAANISDANVTITLSTTATAVNTGALQVRGGASVTGDFFVGNSIYAIGDVTSSYSDIRLKTKTRDINNAINIVSHLNGFYYTSNDLAQTFIKSNKDEKIGLSAQDVQKVLPSVVSLATFDVNLDDQGNEISKTGENYLTVNYARIVPILIEAIKEQQKEIELLKEKVNGIYNR